MPELGNRKPSQLLRHLLKFKSKTVTKVHVDKNELFKQLFMEKMPPEIHMALVIRNMENLSNLADMANAMAQLQGPQAQSLGPTQVCDVKKRDNSHMAEIQTCGRSRKPNYHRGWMKSRLATMLISVGSTSTSVKRLPSVMIHASLGTQGNQKDN